LAQVGRLERSALKKVRIYHQNKKLYENIKEIFNDKSKRITHTHHV